MGDMRLMIAEAGGEPANQQLALKQELAGLEQELVEAYEAAGVTADSFEVDGEVNGVSRHGTRFRARVNEIPEGGGRPRGIRLANGGDKFFPTREAGCAAVEAAKEKLRKERRLPLEGNALLEKRQKNA